MNRTDEAIVLGAHDIGESDRIVTFLTRSHGLVRGVARAARKSRRRFGSALEPMAQVRLTWHEREGRDLHRVDAAELERSHATMQADPGIQAACAVFGDVLQAIPESASTEDDRSFRLLVAVLDALEEGEPVTAIVRYFEVWTLRLHGVAPDPGVCAACHAPIEGPARLAREDGSPRCGACARRGEGTAGTLDEQDLRFLGRALSGPPRDLSGFESSCRCGASLETFLRGALRAYLERPLKTYRHLQRMTDARTPAVRRPGA